MDRQLSPLDLQTPAAAIQPKQPSRVELIGALVVGGLTLFTSSVLSVALAVQMGRLFAAVLVFCGISFGCFGDEENSIPEGRLLHTYASIVEYWTLAVCAGSVAMPFWTSKAAGSIAHRDLQTHGDQPIVVSKYPVYAEAYRTATLQQLSLPLAVLAGSLSEPVVMLTLFALIMGGSVLGIVIFAVAVSAAIGVWCINVLVADSAIHRELSQNAQT